MWLPLNDPLMNSVNTYQVFTQRSNCDFTPLVDHFSSVEYSTKYASKAEQGSKAYSAMFAEALNRCKDKDKDESASGVFASMLVQVVGGRDWSAQEVAHCV